MRPLLSSAVVCALALALAQSMPLHARDLRITGAGASFPFPVYSAWFRHYNRETPGVRIDYQSVGSGAGVRNLINRTVDFAASDAAMTDEEIDQVDGGVVILPMTAGEIVLAYNLRGVDELRLPRAVYPLIFAGEITRWNDPKILEANPDIDLPNRQITVVRRSDSSGTTFVFTQHLSAINERFREEIGTGTSVAWPGKSNFVGAPRNDGVAALVSNTPGAIGYMEYFFASRSNTPVAMLENAAGNFVVPDEESGQAALASADFSTDDLRIWVTDPSDPGAYPITTLTWMLFYREHGNDAIAEALRDFVTWAVGEEGQAMAADLSFVPLPEVLVERVLAQVPDIQ
ncbi:phosphate ABC transporter substrate-binding protein PstS [Thiohalocapsa halophila]|uniref:Phosphate-binding protein PstS n=2 Tax=Thiohalocapsa halophila TaxID=69359 RepID=A0ABS1CGV6_9GAMM|nr:phosphate ABC transporter substrate-binding protein PstS [Thiohalocapsa halophila]